MCLHTCKQSHGSLKDTFPHSLFCCCSFAFSQCFPRRTGGLCKLSHQISAYSSLHSPVKPVFAYLQRAPSEVGTSLLSSLLKGTTCNEGPRDVSVTRTPSAWDVSTFRQSIALSRGNKCHLLKENPGWKVHFLCHFVQPPMER